MQRGLDPSSWIDDIDIKKPLPKLLPNPKPSEVRTTATFDRKVQLNKAEMGRSVDTTTLSKTRQHAQLPPHVVSRFYEAFAQSPCSRDLLRYLLSVGSTRPRLDLAPVDLTYEVIAALGFLFSAMDYDADGIISAEELMECSYLVGVKDYQPAFFRRLDFDCKGCVDFNRLLHFLFPQYTMQELIRKQKTLHDKPLTIILPTREMLSAEDLRDLDDLFDFLCKMDPVSSVGCTLEKYLGLVNPKDITLIAHAQEQFHQHDADGDGILNRAEFTEMHKHCYAPFKRRNSELPRVGAGGANASPLDDAPKTFRKNTSPLVPVTASDLKLSASEFAKLRSNFHALQKSSVSQHLTEQHSPRSEKKSLASRLLFNIAATNDERKVIVSNSNYALATERFSTTRLQSLTM